MPQPLRPRRRARCSVARARTAVRRATSGLRRPTCQHRCRSGSSTRPAPFPRRAICIRRRLCRNIRHSGPQPERQCDPSQRRGRRTIGHARRGAIDRQRGDKRQRRNQREQPVPVPRCGRGGRRHCHRCSTIEPWLRLLHRGVTETIAPSLPANSAVVLARSLRASARSTTRAPHRAPPGFVPRVSHRRRRGRRAV